MNLLTAASSMGITSYGLEKLVQGEVTYGLSSRLGTNISALQDFINGQVKSGFSVVTGMPPSGLQELRDTIGKEGAVGFILGIIACSNTAQKRASSSSSVGL